MEYPREAPDPLSATRQAGVAHDLTVIFADRRKTLRTTALVKTVEQRRRGWFSIPVIALSATALVGAAAGMAWFVGEVSPTVPPTTTPKTRLVNRDASRKMSPVADAERPLVSPASDVTVPTSPPSVAVASRPSIPADGEAQSTVRPPFVRSPPRHDERLAAADSGCDDTQDDERAWCLRPNLLTANRQLRGTYETARRAGVDSDDLARIQERWTDLQERAVDRPDDTLEGYRDLRRRLLDLIAEQRSGGSDW